MCDHKDWIVSVFEGNKVIINTGEIYENADELFYALCRECGQEWILPIWVDAEDDHLERIEDMPDELKNILYEYTMLDE